MQKGAHTKRQAVKIRNRWRKQGYRSAAVLPNPKSLVGKRNIKKYTVVSGTKQ